MDLISYQAGLAKSVNKEDLLSNLELVQSIINSLLTKRKALVKLNMEGRLDSPELKNSPLKMANSRFKMVLRTTPLSYFYKFSKEYTSNLQALQDAIERLPNSPIDTKSATLDIITLLASVEAFHFSASWLLTYSHELTKAVYRDSLVDNDEVADELEPQRSIIRNLSETTGNAIWGLKVSTLAPTYFLENLDNSKAIFITPSVVAEVKAAGGLKGNPLSDSTASGFMGNPFYAVGSYIAGWVAHSHSLASEELIQLELMLSELERADGAQNPAIEKQIIILNERIADKRQLLKELAD